MQPAGSSIFWLKHLEHRMKKTNKRFIGLIGVGYWGKNLLRNLYELGVLAACCDIDDAVISRVNENLIGVICVASVDDVLRDESITAVAIATPAATHYEIAKKALSCGKDIFVEKPLALTVKEGEDLIRIARKQKKIIMVGHILHYHPAVIKLKELITNKVLGKIQYVYSNRLNIGKLRTEENILWSFAPHDISAMLMLAGSEPDKLVCFGGAYLNKGVYDTTLTTIEFKNGIKGHIFVSWLHPFKEQKLIVVGSKAMAVFDDMRKDKLFIYKHRIEWRNGRIPIAHKANYEVMKVVMKEPLRAELEQFIKCVGNRRVPDTDGNEGLKVLKILELCERSLLLMKRRDK